MWAKALTIAGFDGSGGAGLQADIKTFSALGCYGMSVITALPVQNTCGVKACYEIPIQAISDQLETLFEDIRPNVIKIGMLLNVSIISLVAKFLKNYAQGIPVVLDPVMVAKSGDRLLHKDAVEKLREELLPLATIITPNLDEVYELTGLQVTRREQMPAAAQYLINLGAHSVLIKGGHLSEEQACDYFQQGTHGQWLCHTRVQTKNTHGTGCTLSAAIASGLALGLDLFEACQLAKDYLSGALQAAQFESVGHGHGPVNHFYNIWPHLK